jgi:general secretion pathway protein G
MIELIAAMTLIGALSALAIPRGLTAVTQAKIAHTIGDLGTLQLELASGDTLPDTLAGIGRDGMLDPWDRPYVYLKFGNSNGHAPPAGARRDRFLVPVNSDYDLYSVGADGKSAIAFTAQSSQDDIVRAIDGAFIGLASKF